MRNIECFFHPKAVAVIGATNRRHRVGQIVARNLLAGGFDGPIMPVNPRHRSVGGVLAYPSVESLPVTPDLAILCTPPATIPGILDSLGRRGTRAAIIMSGGFESPVRGGSTSLHEEMLAVARPHGLRLLGTDSLGVIVPSVGLNASFAHTTALPGTVAFISQSGALCAAVLDGAQARGIGFSHFVSLGRAIDIDFGDVMDYLAQDARTRAILLYIEEISERRNFLSVGRAAARNKPVLVVKANRFQDDPDSSPRLPGGATVTADEVFDAALRRAGMLRVENVDELFAAFETLTRARPIRGNRLMVLTNGGGTGTMASDALIAGGGRLAKLSENSIAGLDELLHQEWSGHNPVDLRFDASGDVYAKALSILRKDAAADAVLVTHTPSALVHPEDTAGAVIRVVKELGGNILTSWVGQAAVAKARSMFASAGVPTYQTPGEAVRAFLHMVNYHRNQQMLMEVPPSVSEDFVPSVEAARGILRAALAAGRYRLSDAEMKALLCAYGLPTVQSFTATTPEQAAQFAEELGFPVALTLIAPGLAHSWELGGVALNLQNTEAVSSAAAGMLSRLRELDAANSFAGLRVRRMLPRQNTRQLLIGISRDRIFGPVILFGEGGPAAELIHDRAVALPPLNTVLAREVISRTRVSRLLAADVNSADANLHSACTALLRVSQMIIDLPELVEAELNPVFVNEQGLLVVDSHMSVSPFSGDEATRLAIRPYPKNLEEFARLADGRKILLRPIRPEDEPAHHALVAAMSPEDLRFRFFGYVGSFDHTQMARFTQIDYEREMAFIATTTDTREPQQTLGVVRCVASSDNQRAEFSIMVRPQMRGTGLATLLMDKLIRYCRERGIPVLVGDVLAENTAMLRLAQKLGFSATSHPEDDVCQVALNLN
jgi:acetyltransferase